MSNITEVNGRNIRKPCTELSKLVYSNWSHANCKTTFK